LELGIEEELVKSESQTKINYELKCEPESFIVKEMIPARRATLLWEGVNEGVLSNKKMQLTNEQ